MTHVSYMVMHIQNVRTLGLKYRLRKNFVRSSSLAVQKSIADLFHAGC